MSGQLDDMCLLLPMPFMQAARHCSKHAAGDLPIMNVAHDSQGVASCHHVTPVSWSLAAPDANTNSIGNFSMHCMCL